MLELEVVLEMEEFELDTSQGGRRRCPLACDRTWTLPSCAEFGKSILGLNPLRCTVEQIPRLVGFVPAGMSTRVSSTLTVLAQFPLAFLRGNQAHPGLRIL